MKHLLKVETQDDGVLITLAIKVTPEEAVAISQNSNDPYIAFPKDLVKGYRKGGLDWLLHLLRLYIHFGDFPLNFEAVRTKKKKRRILK